MTIGDEILNLLKEKANGEWEYHNPHFLTELRDLIESYYSIEDDTVDQWIFDMFGA